MASLFKRKDSPYWWKKTKVGDKWKAVSTKWLISDPLETKKAQSEVHAATSIELDEGGYTPTHRWAHWVLPFLETHTSGPTLKGYLQSWHWLATYLHERGIVAPAQLKFQDAFDYIAWRRRHGAKKITKDSTAQRDLKVLRILMRHAVRSNMAQGNPVDRMGLKRPDPEEKRELERTEVDYVHKKAVHYAPWIQWATALTFQTGCRISDCDPARIRMDRKRRKLTFLEPKGGKMRAFSTLLPDGLADQLENLKKKYGATALVPPKGASQRLRAFFKAIGLKGVSIHCARVTVINEFERAGIPERVVRKAVNHASTTSHRVYQRHRMEELEQLSTVCLPRPPAVDFRTSD